MFHRVVSFFVARLPVSLAVLTLGLGAAVATSGCEQSPPGPKLSTVTTTDGACTTVTPECLHEMSFVDTLGNRVSAEDLANKVVIVNLWATWCGPCKHEIPAFSKVATSYKGKDVVIVGLLTDDPEPQVLLDFMTDYGISYPVVPRDGALLSRFDFPRSVSGIPTTFAYDRKGNRRTTKVGPMNERELRSLIDRLLAEA